jgi:hypothetical protein
MRMWETTCNSDVSYAMSQFAPYRAPWKGPVDLCAGMLLELSEALFSRPRRDRPAANRCTVGMRSTFSSGAAVDPGSFDYHLRNIGVDALCRICDVI